MCVWCLDACIPFLLLCSNIVPDFCISPLFSPSFSLSLRDERADRDDSDEDADDASSDGKGGSGPSAPRSPEISRSGAQATELVRGGRLSAPPAMQPGRSYLRVDIVKVKATRVYPTCELTSVALDRLVSRMLLGIWIQ